MLKYSGKLHLEVNEDHASPCYLEERRERD